MTPKNIFEKYGCLHVKDVVDKELCNFLTHVMLRSPAYTNRTNDEQVQNCLAVLDHEVILETLLERTWHKLEFILEEELIPTYAYGRVYKNGSELKKHTDRPSCEVSVTIQLHRSHHYAWPIYMEGQRFDLGIGEGIIYKGCELEHWRNICDGPEDYFSGQVFLHFVKKNGQHKEWAGDKRWGENIPFEKDMIFKMETK